MCVFAPAAVLSPKPSSANSQVICDSFCGGGLLRQLPPEQLDPAQQLPSPRTLLKWVAGFVALLLLLATSMLVTSIRRGSVVEGNSIRGTVIQVLVRHHRRIPPTRRLMVRISGGPIVVVKPQPGVFPRVGQIVLMREISHQRDSSLSYRVEETWNSIRDAPPHNKRMQTDEPRPSPSRVPPP